MILGIKTQMSYKTFYINYLMEKKSKKQYIFTNLSEISNPQNWIPAKTKIFSIRKIKFLQYFLPRT